MKYMCIPTKIKRELVIFGVDYEWKEYTVKIVGGGMVASNNLNNLSLLVAINTKSYQFLFIPLESMCTS